MNENDNIIVDFFIARVKIVGYSQGMENYGLEYLIKYLESCGVDIVILTTDQHKQIRCFLRKEYPEICHQFDIWHRAKNLKKKLGKIVLKKETKDLQLWIRAVINHFWYSCATYNEDVDLLRDKWTSILYHIHNIHHWKDSKSMYSSCAHAPLSEREHVGYKCLVEERSAYEALKYIVMDKQLLNDMPSLNKFKHSGHIQVYHSLINKYCPNRLSFT